MSHNPRVISNHILDNQLEVYGDNTYQYNDDGYLQTKTTPDGTTTYSYGAMGELLEVQTPTQTISYLHNASNQRVAKLVDGTITEKYLWANLTTLLAIYDKDSNLLQRFEYADQRMPIAMVSSGTKYYLHYDQVGTLRAVTDSSHTIVKEIVYDTYGNILTDSNPTLKVPFGFAGGLYDQDTKLIRFGYRDYDAYTGKWTAKDPIGFAGGDSNLYGYVLGDPVGFVDPLGLEVWNCKESGIGGHHYNCVRKNGEMICQSLYPSQQIKAPDIYLPSFGLPAVNDQYNSKICKKVDDNKNYCIENCLLKIWNSPRPDYALGPLGSDCQEYTEETLEQCIESC